MGSAAEERLLGEIGALMRKLQGQPVPEEFHRRMARGEAYVEMATGQAGFERVNLMSAFGYERTQSPHRNDDRFHPQSRHSSPLCAFSALNFKLKHYPGG